MVSIKKKLGQYMTPSKVTDFIVSLLEENSYNKIIDSGCGAGAFIDALLNSDLKFEKIKGYEFDKDFYENCKDKYSDLNYVEILNENYLETVDKADVIIGNPPYVHWNSIHKKIRDSIENNKLLKDYYNGEWDLLYAFIMKSVNILKEGGELVYITPYDWFYSTYANKVRKYIINRGFFTDILHTMEYKLFEDAAPNCMIFRYKKGKCKEKPKINTVECNKRQGNIEEVMNKARKLLNSHNNDNDYSGFHSFLMPQPNKRGWQWFLADSEEREVIKKVEDSTKKNIPKVSIDGKNIYSTKLIKKNDMRYFKSKDAKDVVVNGDNYKIDDIEYPYVMLSDVCNVSVGMVSGRDKVFRVDDVSKFNKIEREEAIKKFAKSKTCERYNTGESYNYIFVDNIEKESTLQEKYPNIYKRLKDNEYDLSEKRYTSKDTKFWQFATVRNQEVFEENEDNYKIFVPTKDRHRPSRFSITKKPYWGAGDVLTITKGGGLTNRFESMSYILGWLNSSLVNKWYLKKGPQKGHRVLYKQSFVEKIPIRLINKENEKEMKIYNQIVRMTKKCVNAGDSHLRDDIDDLFEDLVL